MATTPGGPPSPAGASPAGARTAAAGNPQARLPILQAHVASIGPALGVAPGTVRVLPERGLLKRTGTRALARGDDVLIDPDALPPRAPDERALLGHELAHIAQRRRRGKIASREALEAEATEIATRAGAGLPLSPPRLRAAPDAVHGEDGEVHAEIGAPQPGIRIASPLLTFERTEVPTTWGGDRFQLVLARQGYSLGVTLLYQGPDVAQATSLFLGEFTIGDGSTPLDPTVPRGDAATSPTRTLEITGERRQPLGTLDDGSRSMGVVLVDPPVTRVVPRVNTVDARHVVLALGAGLPELIVYDDLTIEPGWTPAVRRHSFTMHADGVRRGRGAVATNIRSRDALPTAVATQLAGPMPETVGASTLSTRSLLEAARGELDALTSAAWFPAGAPTAILRRELDRRIEVARATTPNPDDAAFRRGAGDLLLAIAEARPRLEALQGLADPNLYLGGPTVGQQAAQLVETSQGTLLTYVFVALDGDRERTSSCRTVALGDYARLPFQIADMYLREGGAFDTLEQHQRDVAFDIMLIRGHTHSGRRPIDNVLGIDPDSSRTGSADELRERTRALRAALDAGDPTLLSAVFTTTVDSQRRSGLLAIRAMWEQFAYYTAELDTWWDPVIGLGDGLQGTAAGYRDQLDALLSAVERSRQRDLSAADTAIAGYNRIVTSQAFEDHVQAIDARLRHIGVARTVTKILAITALAAIGGAAIGGAVGTGLATGARVFGLGARATTVVVEGGAFLAEGVAFTALSRAGTAAVFGAPPDTSFGHDLVINLATLGLLKTVAWRYGQWRPAFRETSPGLYAAGGLATAGTSAHLFGELTFALEHGRVMNGEERTAAGIQNVALLGVLHLGQFFTRPLQTRINRGIASLLGADRHYAPELARLEAARPGLVATTEALAGRQDVPPEELAEALRALDQHFRDELSVLQRAAREGVIPRESIAEAVRAHVDTLAGLELQLAQAGIASPTALAPTFRPVAPGLVEFAPTAEAREFLETWYRSRGGKLTRDGERLIGEIDGRRVTYVPGVEAAGVTPARTAHAADLEAALGDLQGQVDVRENRNLRGRTTLVTRRGGRVVIEVGRDATAEDISNHLAEARRQLQFTGVRGRLRLLSERALTLLRIRPGEGTMGAEARAELDKLRTIRSDLLGLDRSTDEAAALTEDAARAERLRSLEAQIDFYERLVGSYERGRGFVAEWDTPAGAVDELRTRFPSDTFVATDAGILINDVFLVPHDQLAGLDGPAQGASRSTGLAELVDLARAMRARGGGENALPPHLANRLSYLRNAGLGVVVLDTAAPKAPADPLLVPDGSTPTVRAESALARVLRLLRLGTLSPVMRGTLEGISDQATAALDQARNARSPAQVRQVETALQVVEALLAGTESAHASDLAVLRGLDLAHSVDQTARDVPSDVRARLDAPDLARIAEIQADLQLMRDEPGLRDDQEVQRMLAELEGLRKQVDAQRDADIAGAEREGREALADRERRLYPSGKLVIGADVAREAGVSQGSYTPAQLDALTAEQLRSLARVLGSGRRANATELRDDLLDRASKAEHRDRLAQATRDYVSPDEAVRQALDGARDVWLRNDTDAREVWERLRRLLTRGGANDAAPSFHGPESHRGVGTAPDAIHYNAEGTFQGRSVDVHIYFGGP